MAIVVIGIWYVAALFLSPVPRSTSDQQRLTFHALLIRCWYKCLLFLTSKIEISKMARRIEIDILL
jgi:hypothetical protein